MMFESRPNFAVVEQPRRSPIDELDEITLAADVGSDDGSVVPAGSSGTVVAVWGDGEAFEVEFSEPFHALATVAAQAIGGHRPCGR